MQRLARFLRRLGLAAVILSGVSIHTVHAIMAGGEFDLPDDAPSLRLDVAGEFQFVGALSITGGAGTFKGSAVALSRDWLLTAGHNADLDDDGLPDADWSAAFYLPAVGGFAVSHAITHPDFTGFGVPVVNDDLALLRLAAPLPDVAFPGFGAAVVAGDELTLVGFGRSGYGSYGYTTQASLTDRRSGCNVLDTFAPDDERGEFAEVFRYDFDQPATTGQPGGSLGNDLETIIGPGDSGGPALVQTASGWDVVGINTFTEGYGGLFGDIGGGVLIAPYRNWISEVTGIPEPGTASSLIAGLILLAVRRV